MRFNRFGLTISSLLCTYSFRWISTSSFSLSFFVCTTTMWYHIGYSIGFLINFHIQISSHLNDCLWIVRTTCSVASLVENARVGYRLQIELNPPIISPFSHTNNRGLFVVLFTSIFSTLLITWLSSRRVIFGVRVLVFLTLRPTPHTSPRSYQCSTVEDLTMVWFVWHALGCVIELYMILYGISVGFRAPYTY